MSFDRGEGALMANHDFLKELLEGGTRPLVASQAENKFVVMDVEIRGMHRRSLVVL